MNNYFWLIFLPPTIIYVIFWFMIIKIQPKYRVVEREYMGVTDYQIQKYSVIWGWYTIIDKISTFKAAEFQVWNITSKPTIKIVSTYKG